MRHGTVQMDSTQMGSQNGGVQGLITSMIGFTNAVTVFGIQQVQNAFDLVTDSRSVIDRFRNTLDSLSSTLSNQVDDSKRSALDSINRGSAEVVDRSFDMMGGAMSATGMRPGSGESMVASEVLVGRKK